MTSGIYISLSVVHVSLLEPLEKSNLMYIIIAVFQSGWCENPLFSIYYIYSSFCMLAVFHQTKLINHVSFKWNMSESLIWKAEFCKIILPLYIYIFVLQELKEAYEQSFCRTIWSKMVVMFYLQNTLNCLLFRLHMNMEEAGKGIWILNRAASRQNYLWETCLKQSPASM